MIRRASEEGQSLGKCARCMSLSILRVYPFSDHTLRPQCSHS